MGSFFNIKNIFVKNQRDFLREFVGYEYKNVIIFNKPRQNENKINC